MHDTAQDGGNGAIFQVSGRVVNDGVAHACLLVAQPEGGSCGGAQKNVKGKVRGFKPGGSLPERDVLKAERGSPPKGAGRMLRVLTDAQ